MNGREEMNEYIVTANYTDQPPIDTPARKFFKTKTFSGEATISQLYLWACHDAATNKYTTLDKVTVTVND